MVLILWYVSTSPSSSEQQKFPQIKLIFAIHLQTSDLSCQHLFEAPSCREHPSKRGFKLQQPSTTHSNHNAKSSSARFSTDVTLPKNSGSCSFISSNDFDSCSSACNQDSIFRGLCLLVSSILFLLLK